ncbi:MAG: PilZ domain-containing protein [candidate division NC10 bacterium]
MEDFATQRRSPRYRMSLPVLYRSLPEGVRVGAGWTQDLSEGGSCVQLDERVWPGTSLNFRLQTERGFIELTARVAWSGETHPEGGTLHGVTFVQVPAVQRQALQGLLHSKQEARETGVRLPLVLSVSCRPKGQPGPPLYGRTGDISRGGLSLRLLHAFPPGMALEITIHAPKGPIPAEGMITWVAPPETRRPGELIQHGLRFTTLDWSTPLSLGLVVAESG